jgi:hypothetical protein
MHDIMLYDETDDHKQISDPTRLGTNSFVLLFASIRARNGFTPFVGGSRAH